MLCLDYVSIYKCEEHYLWIDALLKNSDLEYVSTNSSGVEIAISIYVLEQWQLEASTTSESLLTIVQLLQIFDENESEKRKMWSMI